MSESITWLHISDLHAGKREWDARRVTGTLVTDLQKMEDDHGLRPDLVFFTGDAAFGRKEGEPNTVMPDQFAAAHEFLTAYGQALDLLAAPGETPARTASAHPRYTIGLILALDGAGDFEEADAWAARLDDALLVEGDVTPENEPLGARRRAYLALRGGDLETTLDLAKELRDSSQHARAMLLAAVAHFARGRKRAAKKAIAEAQADQQDLAWARAVATGYFNRHDPQARGEFLALLV